MSITCPRPRTNCRGSGSSTKRCCALPAICCASRPSGAGYDTVDVDACTRAGVAVVNQAGGNAASVAEHTFGLMLGVSRRMLECDRRMRREQGFSREDVMGHEIRGKTLGLVGIGHVGTRVAALARAFGMDVIATDPLLDAAEIARRGAGRSRCEELLAPLGLRLAALPARRQHPEDDRTPTPSRA